MTEVQVLLGNQTSGTECLSAVHSSISCRKKILCHSWPVDGMVRNCLTGMLASEEDYRLKLSLT